MYVNVIFAKDMSKNNFYPICDALAQKVLITHKLVFLLTRYLLCFSKYMAASYNAKKIIFKNFNFEIMDVEKCPVRNVSDGTVI